MKTRKLSKKDKERLSKINIHELYAEELQKWDVIVHKEIWSVYNDGHPKPGDGLQVGGVARMIREIQDDGTAYLIRLYPNKL